MATEAYLDTARRRTSVRRHARLVDYAMHDGANARTWLVFDTEADRGNALSAAVPVGHASWSRPTRRYPTGNHALVFETMHVVPRLLVARNAIAFYSWGDRTAASSRRERRGRPWGHAGRARAGPRRRADPGGGAAAPRPACPRIADRTHRHVVRLVDDPVGSVDPLTETEVTEVRWYDDDALPFPLCLAEFDDGAGGTVQAAVARGNVVLADHGRTFVTSTPGAELVPPLVPTGDRYRPVLNRVGLTHAVPYDHAEAVTQSARAAVGVDAGLALPAIRLRGRGETWVPRRDLLASARFAPDFVVEMEDDGHAPPALR